MAASLSKKVGIASLIMMASVFTSRVIGVFRESVIACIGGRGEAVDAYQIAFILPDILNHIVASGFLSITFIPIFSRYLAQDREAAGWRIFSIIFNCFGALLVVMVVAAEIFTPSLIALAAPGLKSPAVIAQVITMTRIILPAQLFFFAGGMFMAVQFAKERFFLPALAPLVYNAGIILGGLLLGPRFGMVGFSWGVLAGAFAGNFVLQYWGAKKLGLRMIPIFVFRHPEFSTYLKITLPLMFGLTMTFSHELFIRFFGSFLPPGSIAGLNYAKLVMLVVVGVFGQAVGAATYPFIARLVAENKLSEANRLLNAALRHLALIIPATAMIMVLRSEVVGLLFQRGKFAAADTADTAGLLVFMMPGAVAFAAQTLVVRGYYAMQNTLFPAVFSTIAVLASIPVYLLGMRAFGARGIALAGALAALFQVILLYALWNRRSANPGSQRVYAFYGKMTVLSLFIGLFLEWFKHAALSGIDATGGLGRLAICGSVGAVFLAIVTAAGFLLRITEITDPVRNITARIRRD